MIRGIWSSEEMLAEIARFKTEVEALSGGQHTCPKCGSLDTGLVDIAFENGDPAKITRVGNTFQCHRCENYFDSPHPTYTAADLRDMAAAEHAANEPEPIAPCPYGCEDGLIYGEKKRTYGKTVKLRADVKPCPLHAGAV